MHLNRLASAILRGTWLIEERSAMGLIPMAERFLAGESVSFFNAPAEKPVNLATYAVDAANGRAYIKAGQAYDANNVYADSPKGSVAIIPISGTIMKDDYCGAPGTDTLSQWVKDAMASPNIIGIAQKVNSPGGTVEGTAEYEALIEQAATMMPVETFTDGQLDSAAYWIAAPTRITASSGTVEVGSIGTAGKWSDYSPSKVGRVNEHYVNADESFDKNATYHQVLKGNYAPIKAEIINPTQAIFKQSVIDNRENLQLTDVTDETGKVIGQTPLTGKVYLAQTALDLGLIDAIGTFDSVLESIRTRAQSDEFSNNKNTDMSIFGKKTNKKVEAVKGKKAADITAGELNAINEELTAEGIDNLKVMSASDYDISLENSDTIDDGLGAINAALGANAKHTTMDAAIQALVADRDKYKKEAEEYGNQPGAKASKAKTRAASEGGDPNAKRLEDMTALEQKAYKRKQLAAKKESMNFNLEDEE